MKKFSILSFLVIVVSFLACISCGYFISSAIITTFNYSSSVSIPSYKVYGVSLQNSTNKSSLENNAISFQAGNSAGYIYQQDNEFFLLGFIYENVNDAELVKNNLKSDDIDSKIISIEIPSQAISGDFSSDQKSILTNILKSNYEIYKDLYDVAISLDTNVFDKQKAKLECNSIYSKHISTKTNLETIFDDNSSLTEIVDKTNKTSKYLSELVSENYLNSSQTFSSLIKYSCCKILLG